MIRTLAKSIREYKKPSILAPVFVTGEVIMECIIPFIIANLVNEIKAGISMPVLLGYGGVLILMAGLSLAFGALAGKACSTASCGFARNLRKDMFYKIQGYSFENIDKFSVSSLVTRLTTDITNVQMAYMMIIRTAVRSPLMLIFSFAMGFIMGGKMAFIFLFTIPVLGIGLFLVTKKTMPLFRRVFRKYDALNASVQENIRGMRVVKAYVREDYEKKKFDRAAEDVQKDFTKAERILAINNPLMQFCIYVVMIFVMSFGSYTVITSQGLDLDVGQMSSLLTYSFQILMSLMMVSMIFVMVTMSLESAERIVEGLSEESTLQNPQNPVMEVKDGSIDFDQVSFKYSKKATRNALSHIDLHIKSGEIIGILGGTGSSKTSLIQLIPRLYDATEGTVKVGGRDVRDYDLTALRDAVGIVLQKNLLFSGTIRDNLKWGNPDAAEEQLWAACRAAHADEFLDRMPDGLDTDLGQGGINVSGGQKQRLCIARTLLKHPKVLIFDDSTSAVDTATESGIRRALAELTDVTKLIIAQRISSVQSADLIVILEDGRLHAVGTHAELLEKDTIYQEIYYSQMKGGDPDGE